MLVITTGVRPGQTLTAAAAEVISTVPHFLRDLSMQGKVPGISHPALATVPHINNLGRYGDAIPPSKDALEMREEALGNEHHNVSRSLSNTAAEDKPGAEALSGLARAFFYAGARSLVVSHWEVDSIATVKLMIEMFQGAARDPKLSHGEALQQSVLRFIDDAKSDAEAHPRFWAPFVVVGEPAKQQ
jgi:CHAT domain